MIGLIYISFIYIMAVVGIICTLGVVLLLIMCTFYNFKFYIGNGRPEEKGKR